MLQLEFGYIYHSLYRSVFDAHQKAPHIWTDHECNRILTAIMAAKPFSWRVIGITRKALDRMAEFNFKYRAGEGFTRAHLTPRIETVRHLISRVEPLGMDEFLEFWLKNDRTIICAKGENRAVVPDYLPIENETGALFSCVNKLAGWRHGRSEQQYLRTLFETFGRTVQVTS